MIYTRMIGDKEGDDAEAEGGVVVSRNNTHSMLLMATDGSLHWKELSHHQSILFFQGGTEGGKSRDTHFPFCFDNLRFTLSEIHDTPYIH